MLDYSGKANSQHKKARKSKQSTSALEGSKRNKSKQPNIHNMTAMKYYGNTALTQLGQSAMGTQVNSQALVV